MATATIHHGEPRGWVAGCRDTCCREAINTYNRQRRYDVIIHGEAGKRLIDATGTKRRVQALMLMGWTAAEIARACGWKNRQSIGEVLSQDQVQRTTADQVRVVYRKLWKMWVNGDLRHLVDDPMRKRSIAQAEAKGWIPGAAWDDIDNPKEKPRGLGLG